MALPALHRLRLEDVGTPASHDLLQEVLGSEDLALWILRAADNDRPLGEICEAVKSLCISMKCSDDVLKQVASQALDIEVPKPDGTSWFKWINMWCHVIANVSAYFTYNTYVIPDKLPTSIDESAALSWALKYHLLPVPSADRRILSYFAHRKTRLLLYQEYYSPPLPWYQTTVRRPESTTYFKLDGSRDYKVEHGSGRILHYKGAAGDEKVAKEERPDEGVVIEYDNEGGWTKMTYKDGTVKYYKHKLSTASWTQHLYKIERPDGTVEYYEQRRVTKIEHPDGTFTYF